MVQLYLSINMIDTIGYEVVKLVPENPVDSLSINSEIFESTKERTPKEHSTLYVIVMEINII